MKRALVVSLCSTLLTLVGCDQVKKLDGDTGSGSGGVPDAVQQRLTQSCALTTCHVAGGIAPDLSAASGGAWVTQAGQGGPLVTFGDVGNSYLIEKMLPSPSMGGQMPVAPGEITPEDVAVIAGWVAGVEFPTGDTDGMTTGDTNDTNATDPTDPTSGGTSDTGGQDRAAIILGLDGDATSGASLFMTSGCNIMGCHGDDGLSGSASPSLDMSVPAATEAQLVDTFLNGKGGMPAQSYLEDQDLADLLAYVTETFG